MSDPHATSDRAAKFNTAEKGVIARALRQHSETLIYSVARNEDHRWLMDADAATARALAAEFEERTR